MGGVVIKSTAIAPGPVIHDILSAICLPSSSLLSLWGILLFLSHLSARSYGFPGQAFIASASNVSGDFLGGMH